MRTCWGGAVLAVLFLSCADSPSPVALPTPGAPGFDEALIKAVATRERANPGATIRTPVCVISCPAGWMFRPQHVCRGGKRLFQDALAKDRQVRRGVDGTVLSDTWVTDNGDYAAMDVEKGSCSTVIARIISSRAIEDRGQHPGEDPQGNPEPPL